MQFLRLFVVPAALFATGTALAGDSWSRVDKDEVAFEEVSDAVFMPKGLLESLPDGDKLLDLIEEDVQVAQKAGITEQIYGYKEQYDIGGSGGDTGGPSVRCNTTTTTITIPGMFGTSVSVTTTTTVCSSIT